MKTATEAKSNRDPQERRALPKVLIIGQPFNNDTGGGITLSNLFEGWDKERLAVVCSGYLINHNTDYESCSNYYQIGNKEHKWIFPFNLIKRKYYSGPIHFKNVTEGHTPIKEAAPGWRKTAIMDYFYPVLNFLGVYDLLSSITLSPKLRKWLAAYDPDVIYAQATSRNALLFCAMIQQHLRKPFVFHMMDDWPSMLKEQGLLGGYWEKKVNREIKQLFDKSDLLLSISDQMAQEYKSRYGRDFITFHNPIDLDFWAKHRKTDFKLNESPSLLYAGRVGTGIDASLETIAQAVRLVNKEVGVELKFILQTAEKPAWAGKYQCVEHHRFVPYNELPKTFSASDFLILPYDFAVKSMKFIRLSMPTKATEYMASGSPLIIFAPEETALVQYAKVHNCAKIVSTDDAEILKEAIKELITTRELRESLSHNATTAVDSHHNAVAVKKHFKALICSLSYQYGKKVTYTAD